MTGSSTAERVTQSDGAAFGIDFLEGDSQFFDRINGLGSERLVDFENVDCVSGDTNFTQDLGNSVGRTFL